MSFLKGKMGKGKGLELLRVDDDNEESGQDRSGDCPSAVFFERADYGKRADNGMNYPEINNVDSRRDEVDGQREDDVDGH